MISTLLFTVYGGNGKTAVRQIRRGSGHLCQLFMRRRGNAFYDIVQQASDGK